MATATTTTPTMMMIMSSKAHMETENTDKFTTTITTFSEIPNQEVSMARQAAQQTTHMTLKEDFESISEPAPTSVVATPTKPKTTKRINNKQNKLQLQNTKQQQYPNQHQHQKTENCSNDKSNNENNNNTSVCLTLEEQQPNISTTDPAGTQANTTMAALQLPTIEAAVATSTETTTTPTATTSAIIQTTKASAKDVENSLNKTQWYNVCFSSKGSPKQKCAAHQAEQQKLQQNEQQEEERQQQHSHVIRAHTQAHKCKSADISRCTSSIHSTVPQINNNTANITTTSTNTTTA
uniref:Uncharacterized protein n=1 Tax=Musca domestica TaxID=7370 RepID=A0A1I8M9D5_MUSDO